VRDRVLRAMGVGPTRAVADRLRPPPALVAGAEFGEMERFSLFVKLPEDIALLPAVYFLAGAARVQAVMVRLSGA